MEFAKFFLIVCLVASVLVALGAAMKGRAAIFISATVFAAACAWGAVEAQASLDVCSKATFQSRSGCQ